jgi:hypothetical protein
MTGRKACYIYDSCLRAYRAGFRMKRLENGAEGTQAAIKSGEMV